MTVSALPLSRTETRRSADHGQVVRIVRDLRLHDLLLLAVGKRHVFAAHNLGNASSSAASSSPPKDCLRYRAHEDEVVFIQPALVKLHQRRTCPLDLLLDDLSAQSW